ncbi:hypothetical protein Ciccas_014494, partial [Cichlidogyrus casuarinus]
SGCYQEWFKERREDANTALRQTLLVNLFVELMKLGTNDRGGIIYYETRLPQEYMSTYYILVVLYAFKDGWNDKAKCVSMDLSNPSASDDFAKLYMNLDKIRIGEVKEIKAEHLEKVLASETQAGKISSYLKILLQMLLCTNETQDGRVLILEKNIDLLSG